MGIVTVGDLLFTFPRRYDDYTRMRTLNRLVPGETVTVVAAIRSVARKQGRAGRPYLLVTLEDGTGTLRATFFGQLWLQLSSSVQHDRRRAKSSVFRNETMMTNPNGSFWNASTAHQPHVPVYRSLRGCQRGRCAAGRQALSDHAETSPTICRTRSGTHRVPRPSWP